jgi:SWI/SNF-related matrix-associated actin-dependent regulator of chromatin subfamily A member 5
MEGQTRISLPITPKKRGGALEDLLQRFGSQNSATSATKARRESSFTDVQPVDPTMQPPTTADKRASENKQAGTLHSRPDLATPSLRVSPTTAPSNLAAAPTTSTAPSISATTSAATSTSPGASDPNTQSSASELSSSEDEIAEIAEIAKPPICKARTARKARSSLHLEGLKMEDRKKEPTTPRRSGRVRKDDILASDTVTYSFPMPKRAPRPRKLGTARARLRDDIAQKTKIKTNNFLVANKDHFLPLLPEHNYVARLVSKKEQHGRIVPYRHLDQQPEGVTATMKPYQLEGLSFLVHLHENGFSGILGDEMGLGKTLQTLSLFQYLEEQDVKAGVTSEELRPYLVVCPLSVLNSWVNEAKKWTPQLKVLRYHGTPNERNRLKRVAQGLEDQRGNETTHARVRKASKKAGFSVSRLSTEQQGSNSYKIVVTTYDTFQAEQSWFKHSFVWRYIVLDEGHKIKSSVTQISTALRHITSEHRLILTGTPLQNNLLEMWALLAWLYPEVFNENTQTLFKESFDLNRGKVNRKTLDDARSLLELIMLRRMKDSPNVNLGLTPKEEVLLYVPLTPMQRFWYTRLLTRVDDAMLDDLFVDGRSKEKAVLEKDKQDDQLLARMANLETANPGEEKWEETAEIMRQTMANENGGTTNKGAWQKLMNLVMQLRKCCSHPYLIAGAIPEPYNIGQHIIRASGKFILLEKLLKNSIEQGKKVLIFSGFTQTLDFCEDLLAMMGNFGQEFQYLRLDGGTARARRNLEIRLFNDPTSDYKVMLLSTRAGGLGINLTTAEDVIFLDEDWNPQITLQAEARAHRIGQTKKVTIYKLCTQGTVEEQMMGRIRKKLYLSAKITESMKSVHGEASTRGRTSLTDDVPEMSTNQLKSLVRRGAQTLSHPEIDVTDMLSWDLKTMMQKCRDKPADLQTSPDAPSAEVDEEKWLSVMERVECAVLDGKRYQRNLKAEKPGDNILPDSITREDRRKGKNTTVMIDGFAINKESLDCADWEAVPTFAGKDPRLSEPKREKRREFQHEDHCLSCFDSTDVGHLVGCKTCPRAYHFDCLEPDFQAKVKGFSGFYCPQHICCDCGKNTTDAGGLIYRCRWCPRGFCEDCLAIANTEELIGDNLPEFDMLGEGPTATGFYIKCPVCVEAVDEDDERKEWVSGMELSYGEQHEDWVKMKEEEQRQIELQDDAQQADHEHANGHRSRPIVVDEDENETGASPPPLTDASLATPGTADSGVSTPRHLQNSRKRAETDTEFGEPRADKKARLDRRQSSVESHVQHGDFCDFN